MRYIPSFRSFGVGNQSVLSPSWSIDFSTGSTYSNLIFTRGSTGTFVDSSGYIALSSSNNPRLTHNKTGSRLGLLVEEQRVNFFSRSEEFDNASWTKTGLLAFGSGSTANAEIAPNNTTTADLITENLNGTTGHYVLRGVGTLAIATPYVWSIFAKKPPTNARNFATLVFSGQGGHRLVRTFDLTDGTSALNWFTGTNFASNDGGSEDYGNGWWRLWIRVTVGNTAAVLFTEAVCATSSTKTPGLFAGSFPNHAGDGISGILIWGAQIELGKETLSSYIPTTTASVTRSADLAHVLDSSISLWGNPGALAIHFYPPGQTGTIISTDNASTAQIGIEAQPNKSTIQGMWSSGETSTLSTSGSGIQKAVHYWNNTDSRFCLNGGTVQNGTNNFNIANTDFVTLGSESTESGGNPNQNPYTNYANCIIRKVEFYAGQISDSNLKKITT